LTPLRVYKYKSCFVFINFKRSVTMRKIVSIIALTIILTASINADFKEGKAIFDSRCLSCHSKHIDSEKLKKNFFEMNNTLLHLKAPTVNMLAYSIMDSPLHIGDPSDPEMQQVEIEEFLKDYLAHPNIENSICDANMLKHYDKKESMETNLTDDELTNLSIYFMGYKKARFKNHPKQRRVLSDSYGVEQLLADAKKENKRIIIEASSKHCHFCKKMKREVIDTDVIQSAMSSEFIFVEIDIEKMKLPFELKKAFKGITPTFFFLSKDGKLLNSYPGSWGILDFKLILDENRKKSGQ